MAVITAKEWLEQYEEVLMPSGKRLGLRKADPFSLIMRDGHIPDLLTHMITEAIDNRGEEALSQEEMASTMHADADTIEEMVAILNRVAHACMVSPSVSLEDEFDIEANIVGISHVTFEDKMHMLVWAMGEEGAQAKTFPSKSEGSVLSMGEIPGVSQAAQRDFGDKGKKPMGRVSARPSR